MVYGKSPDSTNFQANMGMKASRYKALRPYLVHGSVSFDEQPSIFLDQPIYQSVPSNH